MALEERTTKGDDSLLLVNRLNESQSPYVSESCTFEAQGFVKLKFLVYRSGAICTTLSRGRYGVLKL